MQDISTITHHDGLRAVTCHCIPGLTGACAPWRGKVCPLAVSTRAHCDKTVGGIAISHPIEANASSWCGRPNDAWRRADRTFVDRAIAAYAHKASGAVESNSRHGVAPHLRAGRRSVQHPTCARGPRYSRHRCGTRTTRPARLTPIHGKCVGHPIGQSSEDIRRAYVCRPDMVDRWTWRR